MSEQVLSEVSGRIAEDREAGFVTAYRALVAGELPDGLLRTELLRGPDRHWRVQSLWRDLAALEAVRADPKMAAAPRLFREAGSEPDLAVFALMTSAVRPG
ncbi:antibiotic biosynthesis monooxygenase [Kitasatospora sp. NPDC088346]|uniref:antibiotic biosynthesis monooxygenase n=1 Tax=Kitasatospora sp. NPDC088346 TaxID=3364073 RepID=UPI0037FE50B8